MNHPLLPSSSSFSLEYLIDQDHHHNNHFFYLNPQPSSSLANSIFFVSSHHQQQQVNVLSSSGGSCDHPSGLNNLEIKTEDSCDSSPMKWMSSEMRMRNSDRIIEHNSNSIQSMDHNNNDVTIRVCSDCNTTKTPLWRSGPRGPKSLCNACGIRQRKARRAIAAANDEKTVATVNVKSSFKLQCKNRRSSNDQTCLPIKKRFKITSSQSSPQEVTRGRKKKICFEDLPIILSKNSTFQQVFPQDEREAAILLMSLSYGLVHG